MLSFTTTRPGFRHITKTQTYLLLLFAFPIFVPAYCVSFLSIDCGGKRVFTDGIGIKWEPDDEYIGSGEKLAVTLTAVDPEDIVGQEAYFTSRYFPEARGKHCYVLPAEPESTYLIRAVLLHGQSELLPLPASFNVTINSNAWFTHSLQVEDARISSPVRYESILYNKRDHIDVCLSKPARGVAWISSLELRQWPQGVYITAKKDDKLLRLMRRENSGVTTNSLVRWPDDELDRIWYPDQSGLKKGLSNNTILETPADFLNGYNRPPVAVMTDASFSADKLEQEIKFNGDSRDIYLAAYFQIIRNRSSILESNPVKMFVSLAGLKANIVLRNGAAYQVHGTTMLKGTEHTFAVTKDEDYVGKVFLNAYEVYHMSEINSSFTWQSDVSVLQIFQTSLGLTSWKGDPCYPVPYDWTECDSNNRITALYLSNKSLNGTIPEVIGRLNRLRKIYLDNNNLTGFIPSSLSNLTDLVVLALDNNNLVGDIPQSMQNKVGFTFSGNVNMTLCQSTDTDCVDALGTVRDSKGMSMRLIIGIAVGAFIAFFLCKTTMCLWWIHKRLKLGKKPARPLAGQAEGQDISGSEQSNMSLARSQVQVAGFMTVDEVMTATRNYEKQVGGGGYGPVYYGKLPDGREVAVKVNKVGANQGNDEFLNEVALLTRIHHKNLVSLLGYCEEDNQRMLIYEYLHNGNLSDLLYGPKAATNPISWRTRVQLALDAARGLEYLHRGCDPLIIHRDVKSTNILIDDQLVAKIADFGLSKSDPKNGEVTSEVKGTPGYLDPEYFMLQKLSQKSDVYSFGVVLLELISGQRPVVTNSNGSEVHISELLVQLEQTGDMDSFVDPALKGRYNLKSMRNIIDIARASVNREASERPDMVQVVRGLEAAYEVELASLPYDSPGDNSSNRKR